MTVRLTRRALIRAGAAAATVPLIGAPAIAQGWPNKPIKFIVSYPPGGATDTFARAYGDYISKQLGQTVLVENKAGAGGTVGALEVKRSPADGYTVLIHTNLVASEPWLKPNLSYNFLKDMTPIMAINETPFVLLVNPSLPVKTVKEFVEYAKTRPGQLNYASSGAGTSTHLASVLFTQRTGIQAQHVPYKGTAPSLVDMIAGRTQFLMGAVLTAVPHVKEGRLRALAVTGAKRIQSLPELRTLTESDLPGFVVTTW